MPAHMHNKHTHKNIVIIIYLYTSIYLYISYNDDTKFSDFFQNLSVTNLVRKKFLRAVFAKSAFDYFLQNFQRKLLCKVNRETTP